MAGLPALLMLIMLLVDFRELDFALARWFYVDGTGFVGRYDEFLEQVLHNRVRQLAIALVVLIFLAWGASFYWRAWRTWRRPLGYVILATTMSAAVIPALKALTGVHCPWSLSEFGGMETYTSLLSVRAETLHPGRCWPGGHAATGFSLLAFYFALRDQRPDLARLALLGSVLLGSILSLGRMAQGAHFISHNLWTLLIDWMICLVLYRLMLYRPAGVTANKDIRQAALAGIFCK